ncbi:MAG: biotin-dependent carboxyltransferase family protein, partial [Eubacteriales bacterium]
NGFGDVMSFPIHKNADFIKDAVNLHLALVNQCFFLAFRILENGLFSTMQDLGRFGYQSKGITVSGAMDQISLRLANILVGNDENFPCIEMTLKGEKILFESDAVIAITGADMSFKINGKNIEINKTIFINAGDILDSGFSQNKKLAYLAIKGGFKIKKVLGSYSTFLRAKIGGYKGRRLLKGDLIEFPDLEESFSKTISVDKSIIKDVYSDKKIRFTYSSEKNRFTQSGLKTFTDSSYKIENDSDRMGYRFSGNTIEHKTDGDIISGGINFGTIQVPGNGNPIVMMADRQTTGGYTKIGQVILADLPYLAQKKPQESVKFEAIDSKEAVKLWIDINKNIESWKNNIEYNSHKLKTCKRYTIRINNKSYNIKAMEV